MNATITYVVNFYNGMQIAAVNVSFVANTTTWPLLPYPLNLETAVNQLGSIAVQNGDTLYNMMFINVTLLRVTIDGLPAGVLQLTETGVVFSGLLNLTSADAFDGVLQVPSGGTGSSTPLVGGKLIVSTTNKYEEGTSATNPVFDSATLLNADNQLVLGGPGTQVTVRTAGTPVASITVSIPTGASDTFVMVSAPQTLFDKTLDSATLSDVTKLTGMELVTGMSAWYVNTYGTGTCFLQTCVYDHMRKVHQY